MSKYCHNLNKSIEKIKMKTVIVLGSGNSGAGAIHDYLLSRDDFQSPFSGKEFRVVNDPDGIDELYNSLYNNFSLNGSANAIRCFKQFIINSYNSNYNKKNKLFNSDIIKLSNIFLEQISQIKYNGSPQFYFDKMSKLKKINFYFNRFFRKKNAKDIPLINMILPCNEELFLKYAQEFISNIYQLNRNFDQKKNIVIEQGGNFLNPISSTKYYGKNRKIIFVSRDPKAIFWSMKRRNSLSYPGNDVVIFVEWYNNLMKKINKQEFKDVIKINFENFFENFCKQKDFLANSLQIDCENTKKFDLNFTMKNLYKYRDNLTKEEILYIDKNINEYK